MTWKVTRRNAWKDIANLQIKRLNNYTTSQRHAWMTINLKKRKNAVGRRIIQYAHKLFCNVLYLARIGRLDIFVVCEQACSCGHKMDKILWQTLGAFDLVHSSNKWILAILLCGKHSTTMQIWIVSRLWFCRRPWRLKINIRKSCVFFGSHHVCANKLDVQETDFSFTQFNRSWNPFSRCRFTHGRYSRSRSLGFGDWNISFHTEQHRWDPLRAMVKPVGSCQAKHAQLHPNQAHQRHSNKHWSHSVKYNECWI